VAMEQVVVMLQIVLISLQIILFCLQIIDQLMHRIHKRGITHVWRKLEQSFWMRGTRRTHIRR
jgi:hypothetical protein